MKSRRGRCSIISLSSLMPTRRVSVSMPGERKTRREHIAHLLSYLEKRTATAPDRRAAILSAIETAAATDTIERIGFAGRVIARRRAKAALISNLSVEKLQSLDDLLTVDPEIRQTRFHWLRSAPDAPGAANMVALTERITFIRALDIDPRLQARIHSGRWEQMIREGDVTPHGLPPTLTPVADARRSSHRSSRSARSLPTAQSPCSSS